MFEKLLKCHSLFRVFHNHARDYTFGILRNLKGVLDLRIQRSNQFSSGHSLFHRLFMKERVNSKKHMINDDSQTPYIALFVVLFVIKNLGCHSYGSAHERFTILIIIQEFCETEVGQFDLKLFSYKNVRKF
jgi:hypothetical protein